MSKLIKQIVGVINAQVKPYNTYCSLLLKEKRIFGAIKLNLHNERTIAHFFDVEIQKRLKRLSGEYLIISECSMNYLTTLRNKKTAESEIKIEPDKKLKEYEENSHKLYIPDTAVVDFNKSRPHLYFIEYKVDSRFSICKLALDYLKYKYYSSGLGCCSSFIYVLFYKLTNSNAIGLRKNTDLDRVLENNVDYSDKSIFVFKMTEGNSQPTIPSNVISLVNDAEFTVKELEENSLNILNNNRQMGSRLEDNVFFRNKDRFKTNVIYAKTIQENYSVILEMAERIKNQSSVVDYQAQTNYDINPKTFSTAEFSEDDCMALSRHFDNQIKKLLEDETSSIPEILSVHRKRATWVLILLQKLAENNDWRDISKKFKFGISDRAISEYKKQLSEKYQNASSNLNKLSLGLLYFIVNLFPVMFSISSENKVIGYTDQYAKLANTKNINLIMNKIISELGIKTHKKANVENKEFQLELLQNVLNKYTDVNCQKDNIH